MPHGACLRSLTHRAGWHGARSATRGRQPVGRAVRRCQKLCEADRRGAARRQRGTFDEAQVWAGVLGAVLSLCHQCAATPRPRLHVSLRLCDLRVAAAPRLRCIVSHRSVAALAEPPARLRGARGLLGGSGGGGDGGEFGTGLRRMQSCRGGAACVAIGISIRSPCTCFVALGLYSETTLLLTKGERLGRAPSRRAVEIWGLLCCQNWALRHFAARWLRTGAPGAAALARRAPLLPAQTTRCLRCNWGRRHNAVVVIGTAPTTTAGPRWLLRATTPRLTDHMSCAA